MQCYGFLTMHFVSLQETCTQSLVSIKLKMTKLSSGQTHIWDAAAKIGTSKCYSNPSEQ